MLCDIVGEDEEFQTLRHKKPNQKRPQHPQPRQTFPPRLQQLLPRITPQQPRPPPTHNTRKLQTNGNAIRPPRCHSRRCESAEAGVIQGNGRWFDEEKNE